MTTLFHIGPQKAATTWVYRCLSEHPDVCAPNTDSVHYYDMFFARGPKWYNQHFAHCSNKQIQFDPTYTYLRSPLAAERMAADFSDAKIAITLRHPLERAFSHYWHEKKKGVITFTFADVLENYDLFSSWVEPGFYARHIERFLNHFSREQLLCQDFADLQNNPLGFYKQLCAFYEIDTNHKPSWLNKKSNATRPQQHSIGKLEEKLKHRAPFLAAPFVWYNQRYSYEHLIDIDPSVLAELQKIFEPEIVRLEQLLARDFSHWKHYG